MLEQPSVVSEPGAPLAGDVSALAAQVGSAGALAACAGLLFLHQQISCVASLREFLEGYRRNVLLATELPAICEAFRHASRYELRELIALDRSLAGSALPRDLADASQRVGRTQLKRLRPLRDQRLLQRYRWAVERGEAHGWHTLVYGVALHIYSLPLRQGLVAYAQQTLGTFLSSAAHSLALTEAQRRVIGLELLAATANPMEDLLALYGFARLALADNPAS
jgi:urease accessory protein UreF